MSFFNTLKTDLKNIDYLLAQCLNGHDRAAVQEILISRIFSKILNLPFFDNSNNDLTILNKVVWYGTLSPRVCSKGTCDTKIYGHGFNAVMEVTRRKGKSQWDYEGVQISDNLDNNIAQEGWNKKHTYGLLIVPNIYKYTFDNLNYVVNINKKIIILDYNILYTLLNINDMVFTLKNGDIIFLFEEIFKAFNDSSTVEEYIKEVDAVINKWKKTIIYNDLTKKIAIDTILIMKERMISYVFISELTEKLYNDFSIKHSVEELKIPFDQELIINCINMYGVGYHKPNYFHDDEIQGTTFPDYENILNKIVDVFYERLN